MRRFDPTSRFAAHLSSRSGRYGAVKRGWLSVLTARSPQHGPAFLVGPWLIEAALLGWTCVVLVLALLFGGAAQLGLWSNVLVQLASLPLLVSAGFRLVGHPPSRSVQRKLLLPAAIVLLPLIQLVPLPPLLWTALPGRSEFAQAYVAAGVPAPWLPVSLDPQATWRALFSLLPAIAIFLAALSLDFKSLKLLIVLVLGVAFVSVPIGMLQVMEGADSPWRFYSVTNRVGAVGFFANTNHEAALLYSCIPFAAAFAFGLFGERRRLNPVKVGVIGVLLVALVIGLALTQSRAGLMLGFVAGLSCLALVRSSRLGQSGNRLLLIAMGANVVALLIAFQFGFVNLTQKVENAMLTEDLRWSIAAVTWHALLVNLPFGSGFGTFTALYDMFTPQTLVGDRFVNHAHDDWLELLLEGGVPALAIAAAFLVWLWSTSLRLWRVHAPDVRTLDLALARAAFIAVNLLLLHSLVDYPLRTIAISSVFALCCALLADPERLSRPAPEPEPKHRREMRRH